MKGTSGHCVRDKDGVVYLSSQRVSSLSLGAAAACRLSFKSADPPRFLILVSMALELGCLWGPGCAEMSLSELQHFRTQGCFL